MASILDELHWGAANARRLLPGCASADQDVEAHRVSEAMRKSFDQSVPLHEQLARGSKTVSTGRKHQHRIGPGKKAEKALKAAAIVNGMKKSKAARIKAKVRAYWAGEKEEHP